MTAAPVRGQGPTPTPLPPSSPPPPSETSLDALLAQAERTSEDASRAVESVGLILNFLQVAGLLFGGLAAVATFLGARTIFDYRDELSKARQELDALRTELKNDAESARKTLQDAETRIQESLNQTRAQGDRAIRAMALLQLGEQQMEARNWKAALRTIEAARELDPDNRAINYFLGELYIHQRDLRRGIEHLERAQADGSIFPPAEAALAYAIRLQGDRAQDINERNKHYAEAETHFLAAINADPQVRDVNGESVYAVLGGLYRREGRLDDAIRCYSEAERITPQNSYPINNLAMLHAVKGDAEQATHYFRRSFGMAMRSVDANPFDYWAQFDLITAMAALGQSDDAIQQIDRVMAYPPNPGQLEGLVETLKALVRANGSPEIQRVLGHLQATIQHAGAGQAEG